MAKKRPDLALQGRSEEMQKRTLSTMRDLGQEGYDPASVQVLIPMYKGSAGVTTRNTKLQALLNFASPDKAELKFGHKRERGGNRADALYGAIRGNPGCCQTTRGRGISQAPVSRVPASGNGSRKAPPATY